MKDHSGLMRHTPESDRPLDVFRHYLADLVYGANDGVVTTFTVVSGVAGAGLPATVVVIIGLVNLVADGFSMGASNFLAIRSAALAEGNDRGIREPMCHGLATFTAFVLAGVVPLLGFLVPGALERAFWIGAAGSGATLFGAGALRALVVRRSWLPCGLEMLGVGAIAAAAAYGVGALLSRFVQ